jgi:hypothetical protein
MRTKAMPWRKGLAGLTDLLGNSSGSPRAKARHWAPTGQTRQEGRFGVQIVWPRSIRAWV